MKQVRFGPDWRGLALFLLVMAPNVLWFLVPAPVDVLRLPSKTPGVDMAASVAQVLMVGGLCLLRGPGVPAKGLWLLIAGTLAGYWLCWGGYYGGLFTRRCCWLCACCPAPACSSMPLAGGSGLRWALAGCLRCSTEFTVC